MSTAYTTISGGTLAGDWPEDYGASGTLGIFCTINFTADNNVSFIAGDGESLRGRFVTESAITVASGVGTYASYSLPKTDTACTPNTVRYFGVIFDARGAARDTLFSDRHLRASLGDSISELQWANDNAQKYFPQPDGHPTTSQMNLAIDAAIDSAALNQDYVIGSYASLSAAFTAMPATGATLVINQATSVPSNLSGPSHVTLKFTGKGYLNFTSGATLTHAGLIEAGSTKIFYNALAGQGTMAFSSSNSTTMNVLWWATNTTPGTTDMTAAIQAAMTATGGQGSVYVPRGSYIVTESLVPLNLGAGNSPITFFGDGPFTSNLINKASAGKPTLLIACGESAVHGLGFWGDQSFPNDGIKIIGGTGSPATYPSRMRIWNNTFHVKGNGIWVESVHSVWITDNYGVVSSGSGLIPTGVTTPAVPNEGTESFIYVNQPAAGFVSQLVIRDNMNEGYAYQVYTSGVSAGVAYASWTITGNQFEGSTNGIRLQYVYDFDISGNYLGEGSTRYSVDCDSCVSGNIGPNYIHFSSMDAVNSTIRLTDCNSVSVRGRIPRLYIAGTSFGLTFPDGRILRLEDESSDHQLSMTNIYSPTDVGGIPKQALNTQTGSATWYTDDPTAIVAYPTVRLGDKAFKTTPVSGQSPGWVATRASSTGALVQTTGSGPDPVVLDDYPYPTAYDYRITIVTGGLTGTATYDVEWKTAGGGVYALLNSAPLTTSELAHLVIDDVGGGAPGSSISIRWPTQTYVSGNVWTLTAVVAPIWKATAVLA